MKRLILNLWNDQPTFLAALSALGAAALAGTAVYESSHSLSLALGAAFGTLGIGGTATHAIGSVIRSQPAADKPASVTLTEADTSS